MRNPRRLRRKNTANIHYMLSRNANRLNHSHAWQALLAANTMIDMGTTHRGKLDAGDLRIALVVSRFNEFITSRLLAGAREALLKHGAKADDLTEVSVPGAWELPLTAKCLAESKKFDAIVALGCVIRGETTHHVHVGGEAAHGLAQVSLETGIPIGFGLLTTDTLDQAVSRAGDDNKGADAALAAVEMANLFRQIGASTTKTL